MTLPESSRPTAARQPGRMPAWSLSGTAAGSLGEDILLARHGDRIRRLDQDRRTGHTVATLSDGSTDSAPNWIAGGTLTLRPADRARRGLVTLTDALTNNGNPESVREVRLLGRISLVWIAISLLLCLILAWSAVTFLDPATAEQLMTSYAQVPTLEPPTSTP